MFSRNKVEVELDLSNYSIKSDLKNETGVDTSGFTKKGWFSSLKIRCWKSKVDSLYINKLKTVLIDLRKLSDAVHEDVIKSRNIMLKKF